MKIKDYAAYLKELSELVSRVAKENPDIDLLNISDQITIYPATRADTFTLANLLGTRINVDENGRRLSGTIKTSGYTSIFWSEPWKTPQAE